MTIARLNTVTFMRRARKQSGNLEGRASRVALANFVVWCGSALIAIWGAPQTIAQVRAQPRPIVDQGWAGVWTLSEVLSTGSTAPRLYTRGTRRISFSDATVTIVDDLVRVRGGVVHLEWTGKLDGNDYPVEGVEVYLTSAYRPVDDHTIELRQKFDGHTVVFATMTLSADGKSITTTTTDGVTTAKTVYKRVRT